MSYFRDFKEIKPKVNTTSSSNNNNNNGRVQTQETT